MGCNKFQDSLSAFVDETLTQKRWDEVAYHLASCEKCRREVHEIREIRSALAASSNPGIAAPSTLASRLEAIAGEHAAEPLYIARREPGELPSKRENRKRWVKQGSIVGLMTLVAVAVAAVLVAPGAHVVENPVSDARTHYAMYSTAVTVQESVGAILLAQSRGAVFDHLASASTALVDTSAALPISKASAAQMLGHAADPEKTFTGLQRVWVTDNLGGFISAEVSLSQVAGEGASLDVLDSSGGRFLSSFLPDVWAGQVQAPEGWDYFVQPELGQIVGRSATLMEARDGDRTAGRWWFDVETGEILRAERYNSIGAPTIVFEFEEFHVGDAKLPAERDQLTALSRPSSSGQRGWCIGFDECRYELAGLPLAAYTSSAADRSMSLIYSDGMRMISVSWTEGMLDGTLRVFEPAAAGLPSVEVWQAGDGVISVATNGSPELLAEAVAELPEQSPRQDSLWRRFVCGLGRLTGIG